jgi:hypothetical protein
LCDPRLRSTRISPPGSTRRSSHRPVPCLTHGCAGRARA